MSANELWARYGRRVRICILMFAFAMFISIVDLDGIYSAITRLPFWYFAATIVLTLCANACASLRWSLFSDRHGLLTLFCLNSISNYYTFISGTAAVGDVAKLVHVPSSIEAKTDALISAINDRFTGLAGALICFSISVWLSKSAIGKTLDPLAAVTLITGVLLSISLRSSKLKQLIYKLISAVAHRLSGSVSSRFRSFMPDPKDWNTESPSLKKLSFAFLYTTAFNLLYGLIVYTSVSCSGEAISYVDSVVVALSVQLTGLLPSGVAGIGLRDVSFITLLVLNGIPTNSAVATSLSLYPSMAFMALLGYILSTAVLRNQEG